MIIKAFVILLFCNLCQASTVPIISYLLSTDSNMSYINIDKNNYYGAKPDQLGTIGGGVGYKDTITSGDIVVSTYEQLKSALASPLSIPGYIIYIDPTSEINFDDKEVLMIPAGVIVASNRGYNHSKGALLYKTIVDKVNSVFFMIDTGRDATRISGLRIEGPSKTTDDVFYTMRAIASWGDQLKVDNCELFGFGNAINIGSNSNEVIIHHNYIHHNQRAGYGYGILVGRNSDVTIKYNRFDFNRHDVAGSGLPGTSYEAHDNIHGTNTNTNYDMHGDDEDGYGGNAGQNMSIHHNYFPKKGRLLYTIGIRGIPIGGPVDIHNNIFSWCESDFPCIISPQVAGIAETDQQTRDRVLNIYDNLFNRKP